MSASATTGIAITPVTTWLAERVPGAQPPLDFDLITGGHSNLTYRVTDAADGAWVLRRPPLHQVLATAHDMEREHRIIAALGPTDVPVPSVVGLCTDEAVNGPPFYVMDFVDGVVARTAEIAESALSVPARRAASRSLVETLARIHRVDLVAVGLDDLGRKEGYVERQLKRWLRQVEQSEANDRPDIVDFHGFLAARVPDQGPATIVHGDFRLDNCIVHPDGEVAAVLDWELCTLGDPLADVAQLIVYWAEPSDELTPLENAPTAAPGFATRDEMLAWYGEASGRDLGDMTYYLAFTCWRLACILEGVYSRYLGGAMGEVPDNVHDFDVRIRGLMGRAHEYAGAIS